MFLRVHGPEIDVAVVITRVTARCCVETSPPSSKSSIVDMDLGTAIQQYGYPAVFVGAVLEGETVLALAGMAAHNGYLSLPWVIAAAGLGGFAGDQFYFVVGRRYGQTLISRRPRVAAAVQRAHALLERYPSLAIISMRFLYGLRIATSLAMGIGRIHWLRFASLNLLSAIVWAPLYAGAGYLFADALELLLGDLKRVEHLLFAGVFALGAGWWLSRRLAHIYRR